MPNNRKIERKPVGKYEALDCTFIGSAYFDRDGKLNEKHHSLFKGLRDNENNIQVIKAEDGRRPEVIDR